MVRILLILLLSAELLAFFLLALIPDFHVDALYYHVYSAWLWGINGRFFHIEWAPWYMQGGLVEYLYATFAYLFRDRFLTLIVAQELNCCMGLFVSSFLLYKISRKYLQPTWALLVVLSFVLLPYEKFMLARGKNDGWILACFMGSFYLWLEILEGSSKIRWKYFWYAILQSFAFACKHNAVFFMLPMNFILFGALAKRQSYREILQLISFFILLSPLSLSTVVRNYWLSSNPFFPAMNEYFPSPLINDYIQNQVKKFVKVEGSAISILWSQLNNFFLSKLIFVFALLPPKRRETRNICFFVVLSWLLFMLVTGKGLSFRFAFFLYVSLALLSAVNFYDYFKSFFSQKVLVSAAIVLIMVGGQYETVFSTLSRKFRILYEVSFDYERYAQRVSPIYVVHKWANNNISKSSYVLSDFDNTSFYLDAKLSVPENHLGASMVKLSSSYAEALKRFDEIGFTHLQRDLSISNLHVITENLGRVGDFNLVFEDGGYQLWERVH